MATAMDAGMGAGMATTTMIKSVNLTAKSPLYAVERGFNLDIAVVNKVQPRGIWSRLYP
jgi:hypothetical protein